MTLSDPVAGYSSFRTRARFTSDLGDSEQTPVDLATAADYAQLTALRAPRPTLLTYNLKDNCCFASPHALPPLMDAALPVFKLYGKEHALRMHINEDPGTHNYEIDNRQALYRMLQDFFYPDDESFSAVEIPCDTEVKTYDELLVAVPEDNETLHSLAMKLSETLPQPTAGTPAQRRRLLRGLLRSRDSSAWGETIGEGSIDGATAVSQWKFSIEGVWTVPATVFAPQEPKQTVLVIADAGRGSTDAEVGRLVSEGSRVIALDPYYFGESKIAQRDFLYSLLISAVGSRPLGIQSDQLLAIADWSAREFGQPVGLSASGPRTSLIAMAAAAQSDAFVSVKLHDCHRSLRQIIQKDIAVNEQPEMFCFGLLQEFDVPELIELAGQEQVTVDYAE